MIAHPKLGIFQCQIDDGGEGLVSYQIVLTSMTLISMKMLLKLGENEGEMGGLRLQVSCTHGKVIFLPEKIMGKEENEEIIDEV